MFEWDGTVCSNLINHSRFNSQHNWGEGRGNCCIIACKLLILKDHSTTQWSRHSIDCCYNLVTFTDDLRKIFTLIIQVKNDGKWQNRTVCMFTLDVIKLEWSPLKCDKLKQFTMIILAETRLKTKTYFPKIT